MVIPLTVFGTAFLLMATIGLFQPIPAWLLNAGTAAFFGLVLLAFADLLRHRKQ